MAASTAGRWSAAPNMEPVSAAATPRAENVRQMPSTYATARTTGRPTAPVLPPKKAIVTEISGYTHGVRLSARPRNATQRKVSA